MLAVPFNFERYLHSGRSKVTCVTVGRDANQCVRVCKVKSCDLQVATIKLFSKTKRRNVTRNRAAIEVKKKKLDPEGRTPPFKRLTCVFSPLSFPNDDCDLVDAMSSLNVQLETCCVQSDICLGTVSFSQGGTFFLF